MAYNQFTSSETELLSGVSENCDPQIGVTEKLILTTESFEIATKVLAQTESTWTNGIVAGTVYPLPPVEEYADESEEATYYTSPVSGWKTFVKEGKHSFVYRIKFNPGLHARLRFGINGKKMRLFQVDGTKNVIGTSPDGVKVKGWVSGLIRVELWKPSDGSNIAFTVIKFTAESAVESNDQIAVFPVTFDIVNMNGVQPVTVTVFSASSTSVVVDLDGTEDGVAISGLTSPAEFLFTKASDGAAQTISTVTESSTIDGRYTLAGTGLVTGPVNLNGVVTLAGAYYKGTAATATIS